MTRILLYSDEPILAKGLESVLRQVEGFDLLPTCNTVAGVVDQVAQGTPDLVLLDLTSEITFAVLSDMKHAIANTKIVLWVNSISTELAFQAMGLGRARDPAARPCPRICRSSACRRCRPASCGLKRP